MDDGRGAGQAASPVLFWLATATAIGAAALALSDGFHVRILGLRVSSHGGLRPAFVSLLFAVIAYRRMPRWQQGVAEQRVRDGFRRLVPWMAPVAAAVLLALCFVYGTRAAGGSDTYGYVSQARLWLTGDLHVHQDFVASAPWPDADRSFTPLGYRSAGHHTLVPSYAPGLPLLMALFLRVGGSCGPFLITPLSGALLILLTAVLGSQVSGRTTGALAALLTATSPTILMMVLWPMSDVPAATFWMLSLVVAWQRSSSTSAVLSGISAGIAILIRPNLAPLAVFPGGMVAWRAIQTGAPGRRLMPFALGCIPFVSLVAWVNHNLYGSFLMSGYGEASSIYHWQNLWANLHRYPQWLWETQGPYVFASLFAVAIPPGPKPESRLLRWILIAYIVTVFGCYLFYRPFDDWWYLRFVIPAMPAMFVLSIDAIQQGVRRFGWRVQGMTAAIFTVLSLSHAIGYARLHTIFDIGDGEQKYADVGRYLARDLAPDTVVITGIHSGSIRLYGHLRTLRVDLLDGAWLDRAIEHLKSVGPSPYLVLEGYEIPIFRQRFANQKAVALVDRPAVAVHSRQVYVFTTDPRSSAEPEIIPHTTGCN